MPNFNPAGCLKILRGRSTVLSLQAAVLDEQQGNFTSTSIFFSLKKGGSWDGLIDGGLQDSARFECQDLSVGNRYRFSGLQVTCIATFFS
jgi:hypothetical protein